MSQPDAADKRAFRSGGNNTYYAAGYDPLPSQYWRDLDNHRNPHDALNAYNTALLAEIRRRAKLEEHDDRDA